MEMLGDTLTVGPPAATDVGYVAVHTEEAVRLYARDGSLAGSRSVTLPALGHADGLPVARGDAIVAVMFGTTVGVEVAGWNGAEMENAWSHTVGLSAAVSNPGLRSAGGALVVVEGVRPTTSSTFERTGAFSLSAVDASTGKIWQTPLRARVDAAPVEGPNGDVFVLTSDRSNGEACRLIGIEADGEVRFTRDLLEEYFAAHPDVTATSDVCANASPYFAFGRVWTDTPDGLSAFTLDGTERFDLGVNDVRQLVAHGDGLWALDGERVLRVNTALAE
jgi:hypothetical protein